MIWTHNGEVSDSVTPVLVDKRPAGRPPLPEDEIDRRKRAILDAALDLVAAKGAGAVRLRDVARAAGVSVGSLQYYFDSRDQLIREAWEQNTQDVIAMLARADTPGAVPWERLVAVLEAAVLHRDLRRAAALWMEFTSASLHDEQLRALLKGTVSAWRDLLGDVVRSGIEAGDFRPALSPDTVVSCLVALIDGFELTVSIDVKGATQEDVMEKLLGTARVLLVGQAP